MTPPPDAYDLARIAMERLDDSLIAWEAQQKELVIIRQRYIDVSDSLESSQADVHHNQRRIRDLQKVNSNLIEKNNNQYDIIQNQQRTAQTSSESTVVWRNTVANLRDEVEKAKGEGRYGHLRGQIDDMIRKSTTLRNDIRKMTAKNDRQRDLIVDRDKELKRVRGQRNDANSSIGGQATKIRRQKDKIISLESKIIELTPTRIRMHDDCPNCGGHDVDDFVDSRDDCRNGNCSHILGKHHSD